MNNYISEWRIVEGNLSEERINLLPACLEKNHLFMIRDMLSDEGYEPDEFQVKEYPADGVYILCREQEEDYFTVHEEDNHLIPVYVKAELDENGVNCFSCKEITTAIALNEA